MPQNIGLFWLMVHEIAAGVLQMSIRSCWVIVYLIF